MSEVKQYYIGWDVGGWSCTQKSESCDAIIILNKENALECKAFRESLKEIINLSNNTNDFLTCLFKSAGLEYKGEHVVLAIDAPLGYSKAFIQLVCHQAYFDGKFDKYQNNPYLFRETEQHIFKEKILNAKRKLIKPLSAVNNMIGAQSTKGIHVISKFAKNIIRTGVWSDNYKLTVIETYPSINHEIDIPSFLEQKNKDITDAYICAKIAERFDEDPKLNDFVLPPKEIPQEEGWIWYLKK